MSRQSDPGCRHGLRFPKPMKRAAAESEQEKRAINLRRNEDRQVTGGSTARSGPVVSLHRAIGNQAVQSAAETERKSTSEPAYAGERATEHPASESGAKDRWTEPTKERDRPNSGDRSLRHLQQSHGNQAVQRLAKARVQPRLEVGRPDDRYEREADRVARQVMRKPQSIVSPPTMNRSPSQTESQDGMCARCQQRLTQGKPLDCEECERTLQRKERSPEAQGIDSGFERQIQSLRGSGSRLPQSALTFFESRFGRDFGDVRVHTGPRAHKAARSIRATAFTLGRDIFFSSGAYRLGTPTGDRLLAHELTHVVQQSASPDSGRIQRECVDGRWEYEYDGCSIPPSVAAMIGAVPKDNPARGSDTHFALPNGSQDRPCDRHDECYQTCHGNSRAKEMCDRNMYENMKDVCENSQESDEVKERCRMYAEIYYNGLEGFARGAFLRRQAEVCGCEGGGRRSTLERPPGLEMDIPFGWTFPLGDDASLRAGGAIFRPTGSAPGDVSFGAAAEFTYRF